RGRAEQGEQDELPVRPVSEGFSSGMLRGPTFSLELREQGGLAKLPTNEQRGGDQHGREQERDPPSPCVERRRTEAELECEDDAQGPEWPHRESRRERPEGQKECARVGRMEKLNRHQGCEGSEDVEVIPLDYGPRARGGDDESHRMLFFAPEATGCRPYPRRHA